ncbi:hypothetical protein IMSHALPRED_004318 [Imshaugia aleurites]|uniref:Uncharacterized protein n=1 Tax=Imshaugia aleurites TaxID=172621 RepID=A0A8H3F6A2_9LECA|nr:hypothetical protein IMSHALPRED_004318 [Imshaugia aleurites]
MDPPPSRRERADASIPVPFFLCGSHCKTHTFTAESWPAVRSSRIYDDGTWFPTVHQPGSDDEQNIILYFHDDSFVIGYDRSAVCGFAASTLAKDFYAKISSFSSRLSSSHGCQFPAALQDAVTAYAYLLG